MPTASDIVARKGSAVHTIHPEASVLEATQKMNMYKCGALVVMHQGQVAGIFTERDVLRRVVADMREPRRTIVAEVMTDNVVCVPPDTDIEDVSAMMQQRKIRHLPVCEDGGKLQGIISIGDVNAYHVSNQEEHINFLSEYIYGRA